MKTFSLRFILATLAFVACVALTSSCNKGYGCPSNFHANAQTEVSSASTTPSC